jgi:DNA invertase Pin-like site-specific DNA recombinase
MGKVRRQSRGPSKRFQRYKAKKETCKMKAAIYARVSTQDQTCDLQLRDLRAMASQRGLEITREYVDHGQSGAKVSRPALNDLLKDAKRGKFRVLLVWRLDRLGRSLAHLVQLLEDFRVSNIELVSFSEGLDFSTTTGKLMFQIVSAFAEFERESIRERVRAGVATARAKGKILGRPKNRVDHSQVTQIRELLSSGLSMVQVGQVLNISPASVCRKNKTIKLQEI